MEESDERCLQLQQESTNIVHYFGRGEMLFQGINFTAPFRCWVGAPISNGIASHMELVVVTSLCMVYARFISQTNLVLTYLHKAINIVIASRIVESHRRRTTLSRTFVWWVLSICYRYFFVKWKDSEDPTYRLDWFGAPELFIVHYIMAFEPLPQRWLFDFSRVTFDLDWKDGWKASLCWTKSSCDCLTFYRCLDSFAQKCAWC